MSAFTKGPWFAVQHGNRSAAWRITLTPENARGDLCNVLACLGADSATRVAHNARLISAAPELYAALLDLMDELGALTRDAHNEAEANARIALSKAVQP